MYVQSVFADNYTNFERFRAICKTATTLLFSATPFDGCLHLRKNSTPSEQKIEILSLKFTWLPSKYAVEMLRPWMSGQT